MTRVIGTTEDLLVRAGTGDSRAFAAFYDATCVPAYHLARCRAVRGSDPEELLLAAYREAWRAAAGFDPAHERALTWLLRIVQTTP